MGDGKFELTGKIECHFDNPALYEDFMKGQKAFEKWARELAAYCANDIAMEKHMYDQNTADAEVERDHYKKIIETLRADIKPLMSCLQWDFKEKPFSTLTREDVDEQGVRSKLFGILDMFNLQAQCLPNAQQIRVGKYIAMRLNMGDEPKAVMDDAVKKLEAIGVEQS